MGKKVKIINGEKFCSQHVGKKVKIVNGEKCDSQHEVNKIKIVNGEQCGRQHVNRRTFCSFVDGETSDRNQKMSENMVPLKLKI